MHNPLRSEADVFPLVIVLVAAAALVVALTLITSPIWGILLAAVLVITYWPALSLALIR